MKKSHFLIRAKKIVSCFGKKVSSIALVSIERKCEPISFHCYCFQFRSPVNDAYFALKYLNVDGLNKEG